MSAKQILYVKGMKQKHYVDYDLGHVETGYVDVKFERPATPDEIIAAIECKDLEWDKWDRADALLHGSFYALIEEGGHWFWYHSIERKTHKCKSKKQAQAAANAHNKQQFNKIIQAWTKK